MSYSIKRSPLFYVGDKYKLMDQLLELFPKKINNFYEPFVGGGSVFLNVGAKRYFLNEIDEKLVGIHKFLMSQACKRDEFFDEVDEVIREYHLSCSYKKDIVPTSLKQSHKKTYYAKFNKAGYDTLRFEINQKKTIRPLLLYILLIYGFNRMLRFNREGKFNLPVGNVDFNRNVENALNNYFDYVASIDISLSASDFRDFLNNKKFGENDFIYFDPPYLITDSEYNKIWGNSAEEDLLGTIDKLSDSGVKFALSNVTDYKGKKNHKLINWMQKYKVNNIKSNYLCVFCIKHGQTGRMKKL